MLKNIETRLKSLIKQVYGEAELIDNIRLDDSLAILGINSVDFIKLIVLIENEFEIEFDDTHLEYTKFGKFEDFIKYIESKI